MADNTESIGGVSVSITGDASGLGPAFTAAQSQAQSAGTAIASSFNAGAAGADQITAAIERLTAALREEAAASTLAIQRNAALSSGFRQVGQAAAAVAQAESAAAAATAKATTAQHAAVSEIQATSGALRTLDGNGGIRAAERFLAATVGLGPLLQSIFPIVGALAFAEVLGRTAERIGKFTGLWGGVSEAEKQATEQAARLDKEIQQIGGEIQSIDTEKFRTMFGRDAGAGKESADTAAKAQAQALALPIAYAAVAAQLVKMQGTAEGAGLSLSRMATIAHQTSLQPLTDAKQIEAALNAVDAAADKAGSGISRAFRKALLALEPARKELQKAQSEAEKTEAKSGLQGAEVLSDAHTGYEQHQKDAAAAAAKAAREREEADRKAEESARHQEEIYENSRRVWAETQAEIARDQDELNRAAQRLYDTNKRAAEEADNAARKMALSSNELANKSSQLLSGVKPDNGEKNEAVNQQALQRLQGGNAIQQQLALAIQLKQVGIETNNEIQSRIGNLQQELAAAERLNVPIETRLKLEQQILEAKIAATNANGQTDQSDKLQSAQVQIQQTLTQWKSLDFGDIAQASTKAVISGVDGVSSALARAIVQGKNFGQAITQAGKQIAQSILTSAIETGLKRILSSLLGLIPGFAAVTGAQSGAAAQQKAIASASVLTAAGEAAAWAFESVMAAVPFPVNVAVAPETAAAAFAQTTAFGAFAGGTDSAPGGFAMVGEKGPEIMHVPRGAQIIPNHKIKGYADGTPGYARSYGGSSHSMSVGELHVHAHGVNNPDAFAKAAVAAIPRELKRQTSKLSPYS